MGRNPEGRMRVLHIRAVLTLGVPADQVQHLDRALDQFDQFDQFEQFCTVTQSVGQGIAIEVAVHDVTGVQLK